MAALDPWESVGVALAIGLLLGAERERSGRTGGTAGIRTFALISLTGALATMVDPVVAAVMAGGVLVLVVVGYVVARADDPGLTTEVAAIVALGLGALTPGRPALAAGLSVTVTVLLVSRESLHRFVRETVTEQEQSDALIFFVAAFVLLPMLPAEPVGPYGAWIPQRIWLLVVLIIAISWVGYVAVRVLGAGRGLLVAGLAGGFVSGTATTGVMAMRARRDEATPSQALAGALLASLATLIQLVALTAVVDDQVAVRLLPAAVAGGLVLVAEAVWLSRRPMGPDRTAPDPGQAPTQRPFAIVPALVLAGIISLVLPLALWLQHRYGEAGSVLATAAGALADVHGSSVAVASLARDHRISVDTAVVAVAWGLVTNTFSKLVVAAVAGGARFSLVLAGWLLPAAALVAAGLSW